ncbi:MAG: hypothetical protein FD130_599 [Halothiobacillaceae bacterium]|nr:MAG: hypothetical protein FD130_599 [Halothiobacillaceae bacterium]
MLVGEVSAAEWMPLTMSGSLGYGYSAVEGSSGSRSTNNQALGSLFTNTYLGRPWIGTADLSITAAMNSSESKSSAAQTYESSDSDIYSGTLNLNMLPQSRAPLNLRYAATDTKIDSRTLDTDAFVVLGDGESQSQKIGVTQSYMMENGHRVRAMYDDNHWSSQRNGDYDDKSTAVELDMHSAKQHLIVNGKVQEATRSVGALRNTSNMMDVTHYYYPSRATRLDSRASVYNLEREFDVPSSNMQRGTSLADLQQASVFGFWRPTDHSPWSLSGGVRLFDLSGENNGDNPQSNDSKNLSATLGSFYQYNRRTRFDASMAHSTTDSNQIDATVDRQRVGALFQSDLKNWGKATYQWYSSGAIDNADRGTGAEQTANVAAGHSLQRAWFVSDATSFRVSAVQAVSDNYITETSVNSQWLDHTLTANWDQMAWGGTSYVQATVADRRSFGDAETTQQMAWLQLYRDQRISSRSLLSH